MWSSGQLTALYRSVDRIRNDSILRRKLRTIRRFLHSKEWNNVNFSGQQLIVCLPKFVSGNTKIKMKLIIFFNTRNHNTEYYIEGHLQYRVIQDAFSNQQNTLTFVQPIHETTGAVWNNSKKDLIASFLLSAKRAINSIQSEYEDCEEYSEFVVD